MLRCVRIQLFNTFWWCVEALMLLICKQLQFTRQGDVTSIVCVLLLTRHVCAMTACAHERQKQHSAAH